MLALQSEVAQAIARQIQISIAGRESGSRITPNTPAVSPDVYEDYLKGRFALNRTPTPDSRRVCGISRQRSQRIGPSHLRYSGLGAAHAVLSSPFGGDVPVDALAKKRHRPPEEALELDATIAEAHRLGEVALRRWQWTDADALSPAPSISIRTMPLRTPGGLAGCSLSDGRTKRSSGRNAPASWTHSRCTGQGHRLDTFPQSRRYADAIRELHTGALQSASRSGSLVVLGFAMIEHGDAAEAVRVLERSAALSGRNPAVLGVLVRAYARAGQSTEALRILGELLGATPPRQAQSLRPRS